MKPSFFIVGTQKGGTTSLYNYLVEHPCVLAAKKKEIHYFSDNYAKGAAWYKQHFPSVVKQLKAFIKNKKIIITGEATPFYLFHPHAPERIWRAFPDAKIILMLRNPIDRAYSHYRYHIKLGEETLTFEEAIAAEPERLEGEYEKMLTDENYNSVNYKIYSYLKRGIYVDQLERWLAFFPKEQILVIKSEDFFSDPAASHREAQSFLSLQPIPLISYRKFNEGKASSINPHTRKELVKYFDPYNNRLYEMIGKEYNWN